MPLVQTIISDVVTPRERGQYQAYFSGVWVAAGIGGPVLGGVFAEHLHWSMIFWINVPLALASLALLLPKIGKHPGVPPPAQGGLARRRVADGVRRGLHAGADMGRQPLRWLSPTIAAMIGASVVLALAFVWHARATSEEPFLPLPLMGGPVVPYAMAAGGCALGAMVGLTVHLPLYYQVVYHLSASEAGLALIPLAAISTGGAAIAGRTMVRAGHYKRVAIIGTSYCRGLAVRCWRSRTLPLWGLLGCCRCSRSVSARRSRQRGIVQNSVARRRSAL